MDGYTAGTKWKSIEHRCGDRPPMLSSRPMILVGLTGGVATGKSAHDQDGAGGKRRGAGKEQGKQEQGDPHDGKTGG